MLRGLGDGEKRTIRWRCGKTSFVRRNRASLTTTPQAWRKTSLGRSRMRRKRERWRVGMIKAEVVHRCLLCWKTRLATRLRDRSRIMRASVNCLHIRAQITTVAFTENLGHQPRSPYTFLHLRRDNSKSASNPLLMTRMQSLQYLGGISKVTMCFGGTSKPTTTYGHF